MTPFLARWARAPRTSASRAARASGAAATASRRGSAFRRSVDGYREVFAYHTGWDWVLHSFDAVVVLEARQDDGPDFVTVVEAGLLAKTGLNSSGLGLATNALVTGSDRGEPGVPYHIVLRAILDSETLTDALMRATDEDRD